MENKPKSLKVQQIISVALILYFRNLKRYLFLSFALGFLMILLDLYTLYTLESVPESNYSASFVLVTLFISALISIFFPITFVALGHETYYLLLKKDVSLNKISADSFKSIKTVIGSGLFVFCIYILFDLFFQPLGWLAQSIFIYLISICISLYPFVIAFEEVNSIESVRRSFELIKYNYFKFFMVMLLVNLISPMNLWNYNILQFLKFDSDLLSVFGFGIVESITLPFQALLLLVYYFDCRRQGEIIKFKI